MASICGKWRVKMRGWRWFWFKDVKVIWRNPSGNIRGHNILWGFICWGKFDVRSGHRPSCGIRTLNYKHFKDWIYEDGDKYRGELFVNGSKKRTASFTMERIDDDDESA